MTNNETVKLNPTTPQEKFPILALALNRRAVGAALLDGVGIFGTRILRLHGTNDENAMIAKVREWLYDLLSEHSPKVIVLEKLSPKKATRTNLLLLGLLESTAVSQGFQEIIRLERKETIRWFSEKESQAKGRKIKPTQRNAAKVLLENYPDLMLPPVPTFRCRTDWDRIWAQVAGAAILGLYARHLLT
jgi:hypothetical protein